MRKRHAEEPANRRAGRWLTAGHNTVRVQRIPAAFADTVMSRDCRESAVSTFGARVRVVGGDSPDSVCLSGEALGLL
ncbi:hypothetical protein SKAU_G00228930 [Synaphobranchus kaupii]|uniref:Uncharacterized protein n=1 Tax=Synaphobranchus kaupii TaxID=118154 RepID=A0A9Q1ISS9_SYNKA|nr:hypothetical protein SKAU_G00228930 [Synaphobranchus kaupii]